MTHEYMSNISKSIEIKAPVDTVFTYFARPEHVSDQMSDKGVGMTVIPMDIKEGMGVGTTFRIIGDFGGKRLEWDCETTEFVREEKISAVQTDGPFKKWEIVNTFEPINERLTRVTMSVNYEMPFGPLGSILDKAKFAKSAARGMETAQKFCESFRRKIAYNSKSGSNAHAFLYVHWDYRHSDSLVTHLIRDVFWACKIGKDRIYWSLDHYRLGNVTHVFMRHLA